MPVIARAYTGRLDDLAIAIRDLGCIEWVINGVVPSTDVTPQELGTDSEDACNPFDAIANYFRENGSG